jgi:predicted DCC family thiol-disulfide oxidoreductase YuxK
MKIRIKRENLILKDMDNPVVLFDGVCNFCNRWVNFAIRHDRKGRLRFSPLQGDRAAALLVNSYTGTEGNQTVILVDKEKIYTKSTAVLRITRYLDGGWKMFYGLLIIPRFLRDPLYNWVARKRYAWFGRKDTCMIPTPKQRERFLD